MNNNLLQLLQQIQQEQQEEQMVLHVQVSEEEKYAYGEAAHEARMSLSEWVRTILNDGAGGHHVAAPISKSVPSHKEEKSFFPVETSLESLKAAGILKMGNMIAPPERTVPKWAEEDTEIIAYNRELLFGKNPLRQLYQREADFNKFCLVPGQKYNENGTPRLDLNGDYLPVD
jgi:hypothetical protein